MSDLTAQTNRLRDVVAAALRKLRVRIRIYITGHAYNLPDDPDTETAARWRTLLDNEVLPELAVVITAAAHDETSPRDLTPTESDTQDWGDAYLASVDNRLVGVGDTTWGIIRDSLREGRAKGEGIPELAARVDGLLADDERWTKRAETIARTEVIGANSAGHYAAAGWTADQLGVDHADVVKGWLDTHDTRTRPTHRAEGGVGGQHVKGLDARFRVGDVLMLRPHDPAGPPGEVIDCRCSTLYLMPGDPGYDEPLTAGGTMTTLTSERGPELLVPRGEVYQRAVALGMDPALAARLVEVFDVSRMPPKLKAYWLTHTAWGHPGDFKECQLALRKYLPARMVDGACANLHNEATGHYPGPGRGVTGETDAYADQAPVKRDPIPVQPDGTVKPEHLPAGTDPTPTEPDDAPTGIIIAALPAEDDGSVHTIGPEEKHATLVYLGDTADVKPDQRDAIASVVEGYAKGQEPLSADVTGVESLDPHKPGDGAALVWMLAADPLTAAHKTLAGDPAVAPLHQAADQHLTFVPHVTIGYPDDQTDDVKDDAWPAIKDAAAEVTSIRFDRLALWWGTDRREFPLSTGPMEKPTQEAPAVAAATETPAPAETSTLRWSGVLCPEGIVTGDKRKFADGAMKWFVKPGTPIALKAMFADAPGHDGSVAVGLIDTIERRDDGKIYGAGTWDTSDNAVEARRQNIAGILRGVSVDLDDIEMHLEGPDGESIDGDALFDLGMEEDPVLAIDSGRIRSATLWCIPAYVDAYVLDETVADQVPDTSLVDAQAPEQDPLSLAAAAVLAPPTERRPVLSTAPASAFENPGLTEPTRLTITADGRIFGHLAVWGVCHIGIDGQCITPPESMSGYAYTLRGVYRTSDGETVPCGTLTMGTGHADLNLGWRPTVDHYDNTGTAAAYYNVGEDDVGIWMAGALAEDLPLNQRLALERGGSVSGDWRDVRGDGTLELMATLAVNVPGFPIPAVRARVASGVQTALVASGIVHPSEHGVVVPSGVSIATLAREVAAFQAREARTVEAAKRLRSQRAAQLAARL